MMYNQISPSVQALVDQIRSGRAATVPAQGLASNLGGVNLQGVPAMAAAGAPSIGNNMTGLGFGAPRGVPAGVVQGAMPTQGLAAGLPGVQLHGGVPGQVAPIQPVQPMAAQLPASLRARIAAFNGVGGGRIV